MYTIQCVVDFTDLQAFSGENPYQDSSHKKRGDLSIRAAPGEEEESRNTFRVSTSDTQGKNESWLCYYSVSGCCRMLSSCLLLRNLQQNSCVKSTSVLA